MDVWLRPQALAENSPLGRFWHAQLSTCSVRGVFGGGGWGGGICIKKFPLRSPHSTPRHVS